MFKCRCSVRCLYLNRDGYTKEQIAWYDKKADYMATKPNAAQTNAWQSKHPFPRSKKKQTTKERFGGTGCSQFIYSKVLDEEIKIDKLGWDKFKANKKICYRAKWTWDSDKRKWIPQISYYNNADCKAITKNHPAFRYLELIEKPSDTDKVGEWEERGIQDFSCDLQTAESILLFIQKALNEGTGVKP